MSIEEDIKTVRKGINGSFRDRINAHAALKRIEKRMNDMSDGYTVYLGWKEETIPTLQRQRDTERERADALADGVSHFAGLYHYAAKHTDPSDTCLHAACKAARGLLANREQHAHAYWGMENCVTCGADRAPKEEENVH